MSLQFKFSTGHDTSTTLRVNREAITGIIASLAREADAAREDAADAVA